MHLKYRSPPQEHEFGRPFQLGSHQTADAPEDAMLTSILVSAGDVIIMGSDGLWDNLFDRQINDVAARYKASSSAPNPAAMARELASMAHAESRNRSAFTPYSYAASEWFDMVYNGGKPDDITIVAAFIESN
jgi:protein phosphatase PTC7